MNTILAIGIVLGALIFAGVILAAAELSKNHPAVGNKKDRPE